MRSAALALLVLVSPGCAFGPTCLAQQERGTVTVMTGTVPAGGMVSQRVAYDTRGSQNDVRLSWGDQHSADGPSLRVYATRTSCLRFTPPATGSGDCAVFASAGGSGATAATILIVTHGRGNPEHLGTPPEYLLWIAGDPEREVRYTLDIRWFHGPDC